MKVISPKPVPAFGEISFSANRGDLDGVARIRYMSQTEGAFVVGLEFTPETIRQLFAYSSEPEDF